MERFYSNTKQEVTLLRQMLNTTNDGFFIYDLQDPTYEYLSPRFKEILGFKDDEMDHSPSSWQHLIRGEDLVISRQLIEEHLESKGKKPYFQLIQYTDKNGDPVWVNCKAQAIFSQDGTPLYMVGTHTNVTEMYNKLEEEAKQESKSKDLFMASISHEIRNPMTSILGFVELIKSDPGNIKNVIQYCDITIENANLLNNLLNDILLFSKSESDSTLTSEPTIIETRQFLKQISDKMIIDLEVSNECSSKIKIDQNRVTQILTNLITNASKYGTGKPLVRCKKVNDRIKFSVLNKGEPIPEEYKTLIFKPFERGAYNSSNITGSGLGLSICRSIVSSIEGELWLDDAELFRDYVTCFSVLLPIHISNGDIEKDELRVIYAEDNFTTRLVISKMLTNIGISEKNIELCDNGKELLEKVKNGNKKYDLIISDEAMPGMNGSEAIKILQTSGVELGVTLLITAKVFQKEIDSYNDIVDYCLYKPVKLQDLSDTIDKILKDLKPNLL